MSEARQLADIQRRLDQLEAMAQIRYEKSTYTPTYVGGTTAGVTMYTFQNGKYTRLGNIVIVIGQVNWSAATGTGEARISLPYTPVGGNVSGSAWISGVTFANSTPVVLAGVGAYFVLDSPLTNAASTRVAIEAVGSIVWALAYPVA